MYWIDSRHWKISTGRHFQNGHRNTAQFWKWQMSQKFWKRRIAPLMVTYHYVKFYVSIIIHLEVININVRNFNFHCPISSKFYMWVDNDVPNWFPTLKNFYRSPFSKWPPQYRTNSTLSDFNARTMLNFYRPFFMPCFGSHFENGRCLKNFENAELLL
jgi:hypothetical protein